MSSTIEEQIERLQNTIADMESQRAVLGEKLVQRTVEPLRAKLEELTSQLEALRATPAERPAQQQRKLVTILFMDIVGSTSIIQHMDPEDVGEIFDANLKRLAQPVEEHGGRVTSFAGDAFLAIFGTPTAREDDPERAVRAGLAILERAESLAEELKKEWSIQDFKVRIGVNTGLVLLGGETEGEDTTKGPAVHLAARLQGAAPAGGMLVSHDTYRHIRGVFDVEAMEPLQVKGFDDPVQVYRILRARPRAFRMYTRGVEGVETRMVGRQGEFKYLQEALLSAIDDHEGQVITILGEAGVGKSRLLYELQNWIELQPPQVRFYEGRAHQETQGMPFAVLRNLFEFRFGLLENDTREAVRTKVESGFLEVFGEGDEAQMQAHLLGQWLGFDFSHSPHLKSVLSDAEQLRNRGILYLGEYFAGMCRHRTVVAFLEDIHWADDSSLDTINWLGERLQHQPLLFVCAARHTLLERRPYWGEGLAYHHHLELKPLSRRESYQLVGDILKLAGQVPTELFDLVVEGAEGNPFYVEELVKMLVEDGVVIKGEETWQVLPGRLSEIKVPTTLAGVLQARLESLPAEEQQVLQQASVVGRQFWDQVVAHIQAAEGGRPQAVSGALVSLREREMVYRREASTFIDSREYLFKHDILREVTYESVLKRLRRRYHGLVAEWLIERVEERSGEYGGLIAGHLLQAGKTEQAGGYYLLAGEAALASYANAEAEGYFRQALNLTTQDEQKAACLAGLGESLRRLGKREESVEVLRKGIDLYLELGEGDKAADLYMRLSVITWRISQIEALNVCREGLARIQGKADGPGMAHLLAEAGRTAYFQAVPAEEVISLCQQAIEMAENHAELEAKANASGTLALATIDVQESIKLLYEVASYSEQNGLWNQAGRAYNNIANSVLNNYLDNAVDTGKSLFLKSAEHEIKTGDIEGLLFVARNTAYPIIEQGDLTTVGEQLKRILQNLTIPRHRVDDLLFHVHSSLHFRRGEWSQAIEYLGDELEKAEKLKNLQSVEELSIDLGFTYLDYHRFTGMADLTAVETVLLRVNEAHHNPMTVQFVLAAIYARQGRFAEAHERLEGLSKQTTQAIGKYSQVLQFQAKAELAYAESRWEQAIEFNQALIDIYHRSGFRWRQARQLIHLADALAGRDLPGDRERVQETYRQALEMFTGMDAPGYVRVLKERLGEFSEDGAV